MALNKIVWPTVGADLSRTPPIHRPQHCHPERSEGSVVLGREMLRCAQHDSAVTHTDSITILRR